MARRSNHSLPPPPCSPALTTNSTDENRLSTLSVVGPQANSIWRRLMRIFCQSPEN